MNRQLKINNYHICTKSIPASNGDYHMHIVLVNRYNPSEAWMHEFGGDAEDMDRLQDAIKTRGWFNTSNGWRRLRMPLMAVPNTPIAAQQLSLKLDTPATVH